MPNVKAGAFQLEYFEVGDGDKVVILVHGAGSSALIWHEVQLIMAQEGYRTIAISLLGAGESDRTRFQADYNPENYGRMIRAALDSLAISDCALVGHSLGVSNVLYVASEFSQDLRLRAMILMAGGAGDKRSAPSSQEIDKIIEDWPEPNPNNVDERRTAWEPLHKGLPVHIRDELWVTIQKNPIERAQGQRISSRKDMTPFLNETDVPTLILSGDNDSVVPLQLTLNLYPKLKQEVRHLHVIHGVDHYPNAEVPEQVSKAYCEFLNSQAW